MAAVESVVGIVAGAWGIYHVSVGCVPHRAIGVRPERPAGTGCFSISADGELFGCVGGFVCPDHFCAFLQVDVVVGPEWFEG